MSGVTEKLEIPVRMVVRWYWTQDLLNAKPKELRPLGFLFAQVVAICNNYFQQQSNFKASKVSWMVPSPNFDSVEFFLKIISRSLASGMARLSLMRSHCCTLTSPLHNRTKTFKLVWFGKHYLSYWNWQHCQYGLVLQYLVWLWNYERFCNVFTRTTSIVMRVAYLLACIIGNSHGWINWISFFKLWTHPHGKKEHFQPFLLA